LEQETRPAYPGKGSRAPRSERQPREREEKNAKKNAGETSNTTAQNSIRQTKLAPETAQVPDMEEKMTSSVKDEQGKSGADESRRRRRRGGRNRTRRERDTTENSGADQSAQSSSEDFIPVADIAQAELQDTMKTASAAPAPSVVAEREAVASAEAVNMVEATLQVQPPMPVTPSELPFSTEIEHQQEPSRKQVRGMEATLVQINPIPVATNVPTTFDVAVKNVVDDLQAMLQSAGLVLAVTDPDKLRDVQMKLEPAPQTRIPRVRKPPVEITTEPLELVQTKQSHSTTQ
jgi:ribonuclease E